MSQKQRVFQRSVRRGREFEKWERSFWNELTQSGIEFEDGTRYGNKRGRIDIILKDAIEGEVVIMELKASDWDKMQPHRVRPNALRHAVQIWRYIYAYNPPDNPAGNLQPVAEPAKTPVHPALVYALVPKTPGRREEIEAILNEQCVQVIWRDVDEPISYAHKHGVD